MRNWIGMKKWFLKMLTNIKCLKLVREWWKSNDTWVQTFEEVKEKESKENPYHISYCLDKFLVSCFHDTSTIMEADN